MKLLLDENLPKRLKRHFTNHEVFTVADCNWLGKKNGELLSLMLQEGFGALITFDKNLQYQQNFQKYSIPVFVLNAKDNTYITLQVLMPQIQLMLEQDLPKGAIEIKER